MWRKNTGIIFILIVTFITLAALFISCHEQNKTAEQEIEEAVLARVDTFYHFIKDTLKPAVVRDEANQENLQELFLKARLKYKRFEWAAEYFVGAIAQLINGPPVQEVENADLMERGLIQVYDPNGLQVMEELLFPRYDTAQRKTLIKELNLLQSNCEILKSYFTNIPLSDWRILDAAKLEVFRILTMGITGFDNPLTLNSSAESAASLRSLKEVLLHYTNSKQDNNLIRKIDAAIAYLKRHSDFDSFDRAAFITEYGNKISTGIAKMEERIGYPIRYNRMLRQEAKTLFDTSAFNVNAFAPGPKYYATQQKAELGKRLFFDAQLSGTGTRSCASCHLPGLAFADGLIKNTHLQDGETLLPRNTPSLLNAALQSNLFYDMRALTLEDQANDVIHNKDEMDGSLKETIEYLQQDETYQKLFSAAFPEKEGVIDSFDILNAIASYERLGLTKLNSRFDEYMRGNKTALTPKELKGFNLFMGKAKCATCHFMPLFNGITPPKYVMSEAEVIGVPASLTDTIIDPDRGWYEIIGVESFNHAFKTPTVRNIEKTAPYMHNGIYPTLEDVMEFYNNAGAIGLGIDLPNLTLPEDSLHLNDKETDEVIAFMKSLNSR